MLQVCDRMTVVAITASCSHSQGVLYELITDLGYLNEYGHVWQSLVDITGDGEYYDSQFKSGTVQTEFGVETGQTDLE